MVFVRRWLWKLLQWGKPSLSLASMAWACCLTIREEWSYSISRCQEQHCCATRTEEEKGLLQCLLYVGEIYSICVCNRFYTHFAFIWEVWRLPHKHWSNCNSFFSVTILALHILLIFIPHDLYWLMAHWTLVSYRSHSTCFTGLWATWRVRTNALVTQAGQGNCWVGVSEITEYSWCRAATAKPPH